MYDMPHYVNIYCACQQCTVDLLNYGFLLIKLFKQLRKYFPSEMRLNIFAEFEAADFKFQGNYYRFSFIKKFAKLSQQFSPKIRTRAKPRALRKRVIINHFMGQNKEWEIKLSKFTQNKTFFSVLFLGPNLVKQSI